MSLEKLTATLGVKRAAHLLRRATFGATKQQIDDFADLTPEQAVNILFDTAIPDPPLPVDDKTNAEWITTGTTDANTGDGDLTNYVVSWFVGQMHSNGINGSNEKLAYALREKITLFLHTHFTTMKGKVSNSRALYFQNALFRLFAIDRLDPTVTVTDKETGNTSQEIAPRNFKELTKKVCVDNAMLVFLDGTLNVKGSPNENYAREMFELYTIGRGLEAEVTNNPPTEAGDYLTFKEQDVKAAARVLTGFQFDNQFENIDEYTGLPRGIAAPTAHTTDATQKQFSSYYNDQTITPTPDTLENGAIGEESMLDEISQMVDMIYEREETARQICRKLYRFFIYYSIDKPLDDEIIADLAQTFVDNDYKLYYVLKEIFTSKHFYDAATEITDDKFGGIIKSPLDLVLGARIFLGQELPPYEQPYINFYEAVSSLKGEMNLQGLDLYEPYEVAGYGAYHQFPVYNRNWISTNYLTQRYDYINKLQNENEYIPPLDYRQFVIDNFDNVASNSKELILEILPYIFPMAENMDFDNDNAQATISKERLRFFLQSFLQFTDYDDSASVTNKQDTWQQFYENPASYLETGEYLRRLFNAILQTPEFQLF